ncbi:MAG: adenylate/guanylate cyclase domain-containing protein [Chloroflexi bacterium]|nr:adenylate/guanylate cyclase domain-containing protein [Chloroflexota bacterium]
MSDLEAGVVAGWGVDHRPVGAPPDRVQALQFALRQYLGPRVAAAIIDRGSSFLAIGGIRRPVSMIHADVRGYTTLAEALPPEHVMRLLVAYHGAAIEALQAGGATVDRFIGDAVLALWNAPVAQAHHPSLALRGAFALQAAVRSVGGVLGYGIGVHTGEAVVGNLGTGLYANYTAIGDAVNIAARLQGAAQAGEIVCSAAVLRAARLRVRAVPLGDLFLKGRSSPVEAYRVKPIIR